MTLESSGSLVWANSAAADTVKTAMLTRVYAKQKEYEFIVTNPSTQTALTVRVYKVMTIGGSSSKVLYCTLSIPASATLGTDTITKHIRPIDNLYDGCDAVYVIATNNTILDGSGGFTAGIEVHSK